MGVTQRSSSEIRFGPVAIDLPPGWDYSDDGEEIVAWPQGYDGAVTVSSFVRDTPADPTQEEASGHALAFAGQQGWPEPSNLEIVRVANDAIAAGFVTLVPGEDGTIRRWRVRVLLSTRRLIIASYNFVAAERWALESQADSVVGSVREVTVGGK